MTYQNLISLNDFNGVFKSLNKNVANLDSFIREAQDLDLKEALGYPLFFDVLKNYGTENAVLKLSAITGTFTASQVITADNGATAKIVSFATPNVTVKTLTGDWNNAKTVTTTPTAGAGTIDERTFGKYYQLVMGVTYTDANNFESAYNGIRPALIYWTYARMLTRGNDASTATGFVVKETPYSTPQSDKNLSEKINQARSAASAYFSDVAKFLSDMNIKDSTIYPLYASTLAYNTPPPRGGIRISKISRDRRRNNNQCPDDGYGK